ncbi:mechanosensitive ion channel [Halalkaliarchaeum sp. AArc-GB]|uniref:mechanosensitive ion channel family protein n=1 Tax=Halalkaliarchaeum sp. AArc-GB TaxID=3074078 RepID=UPI00285C6A50|nr:mechanosensitive ion channel domain-containing protein [Halalkaliarchaeum sp. AArc-GB]MDR5671808.1 mechanosensitive ion channel [Halalkaliarchaeum sp. AArc-GB]
MFQTVTLELDGLISGTVDFWPHLVPAGWFLGGFAVVFLLGWYIVEPAIARTIRRRNPNNPTIQEAISRYVRLLVIIAAALFGVSVSGYDQFLGNSALVIAAGTLAIGVAAQTVIGSVVSGVVLVTDPEFNIGNYIEWSDGEGEVKSITLRVTRVHTPGGQLITVPNTTLTSETISRPYGWGRYRVVEHIGIAYEDDIDDALDHLRETATELSGVLADPPPQAYVDEFGSDAIIVRVHYWIEDPEHKTTFRIRSTYARAVKDRLERAGITISPASERELRGRIEIADSDSAPS